MTDTRVAQRTVRARVRLAQRRTDPLGWLLVQTMAACHAVVGDEDSLGVVAVEVGPKGRRVRFVRQPGETLRELHDRANPRGGLRTHPVPILRPE